MASFAEQMVAKYETLLVKSAGLRSVTVDGTAITYADVEAQYRYWQGIVARQQGTRPVVSSIDLSNFDGSNL